MGAVFLILVLLQPLFSASPFQPERTGWRAPAEAATRLNPLKDKPHLAGGDKKIFLKSCVTCHGSDQKGPDLSARNVQEQTDGEIFWKITAGNSRSGMPGFGSLPDGQRWQLVLYIRTLAREN